MKVIRWMVLAAMVCTLSGCFVVKFDNCADSTITIKVDDNDTPTTSASIPVGVLP